MQSCYTWISCRLTSCNKSECIRPLSKLVTLKPLCTLSCRFPKGYTLQFVPFYAAEYTGYHWAVYDQIKRFYGYDDGDATSGET